MDDTRSSPIAQGVVEQILTSPEFQRGLQDAVAACTNRQSANTTVTAATTSTSSSLSQPNRTQCASAADEMRRLFPTLRRGRSNSCTGTSVAPEVSRPPIPKRSVKRYGRPYKNTFSTFTKNVFLQPDHLSTATYKGTRQAGAMSNGYAYLGVQFVKSWTESEVKDHIRTLFQDKLRLTDFELMVPISGKLAKPPVPPDQSLDGTTVSGVFHSRPIYIRPKQSLHTYDEMSESDEEQGKCDSNVVSSHSTSTSSQPAGLLEMDTHYSSSEEIQRINVTTNAQTATETSELEDFSESATQLAVERSLVDILGGNNIWQPGNSCRTGQALIIEDVISGLCSKVDNTSTCNFNIIRTEVFESAIRAMRRKSFCPMKNVSVKFTDQHEKTEEAVDEGGPKRELWRLLLIEIQEKLFEGEAYSKILKFDSSALQKGLYFEAGRAVAMAVTHGGSGPKFLSDTMFTWVTEGPEHCEARVTEVYDSEVLAHITDISTAKDLRELQNAVEKHYSLLAFCGISPYCRDMSSQNVISNGIIRFFVIDRRRAAMEQFLSGLETLQVLQSIREHPSLFRRLLCYNGEELTVSVFSKLFAVKLSDDGSNQFADETRILGYWHDFLQDVEEGEADITLPQLLAFATGASTIPPLGFAPTPKVEFLHEDLSPFPKANTCAMILKLPVVYKNYDSFKANMEEGVISSASHFGFA